MSAFNPVKAMLERIEGLQKVHRWALSHKRSSAMELAKAEEDFNQFSKNEAVLREQIEMLQDTLHKLMAEQEARELQAKQQGAEEHTQ